MEKDEHIKHWVDGSEEDCQSMLGLFASGHYTWSLFVGHLSLEKLLKAYYIKEIDLDFPRIHNLLRLAELVSLPITDEQKKLLVEATAFHLNARYSDYKNRFHKTADHEFCKEYTEKIKELREWLLQEITK